MIVLKTPSLIGLDSLLRRYPKHHDRIRPAQFEEKSCSRRVKRASIFRAVLDLEIEDGTMATQQPTG